MQFANDINRYTLASTASLRDLTMLTMPGSGQCVAAQMELEKRRLEPIWAEERDELEYIQGFVEDAKDCPDEVNIAEAKEVLKSVSALLNRRP